MTVTVAKSAGYCFGVERAIELAKSSSPAVTLGPLIHNKDAVEELKGLGVTSVADVKSLAEGSRVVIRSHGVSLAEYEFLRERYELIDATCPYVKAIHNMVRQASEEGKTVIVVGQREHPEVQGIVGWAKNAAVVVGSREEALKLGPLESAMAVSQTTMGQKKYAEVLEVLDSG